MEHCGKIVFFKDGRFWIQHENNVDCILLDMSGFRGRDGGQGKQGPVGPAGPGSSAFDMWYSPLHKYQAQPGPGIVLYSGFLTTTGSSDGFKILERNAEYRYRGLTPVLLNRFSVIASNPETGEPLPSPGTTAPVILNVNVNGLFTGITVSIPPGALNLNVIDSVNTFILNDGDNVSIEISSPGSLSGTVTFQSVVIKATEL